MANAGMKMHTPGFFRPPTIDRFSGVQSSVRYGFQCGTHNRRARNSGITMMAIGVPCVRFGSPGQKQWLDLWNALYRHRIIFIGEYIEEENGNQLLATMLYLDALDDRKRLRLYINSPGGDLTPSLALYDTIKSLKSPVHTNCCGCAYNMAAFLLAAGKKGERTATPLSFVTMEPPAGSAQGRADDIRNEANELVRIRNYLHKELAKNTGQSVEKIDKDLSRIKHFDAEEAIAYGLIDRIVRPPKLEERPGSS